MGVLQADQTSGGEVDVARFNGGLQLAEIDCPVRFVHDNFRMHAPESRYPALFIVDNVALRTEDYFTSPHLRRTVQQTNLERDVILTSGRNPDQVRDFVKESLNDAFAASSFAFGCSGRTRNATARR